MSTTACQNFLSVITTLLLAVVGSWFGIGANPPIIDIRSTLYTEGTGINPPFNDIRNVISSGYTGTQIDVNNAEVEGGIYGAYAIQNPLRLHTLANSSVPQKQFNRWTRWYQTDGATQIFRLFPGEENVRNDRKFAARIEAFDAVTVWNIDDGMWHDWVGRFTVVKPINAAIFQVKDADDDAWAVHLKMSLDGRVFVDHRRPIQGQNKTETLLDNAIGQPFDIRVRDNGLDYEVYLGNNPQPFTSGTYIRNDEQNDTSATSFRWGMYAESNEITNEGLLFVSHATVDPSYSL